MTGNRLRIGLIGVGRIGKLHAEHLAYRVPAAELIALADVSEEAVRGCADRLGVREWTTDHRALISRPDIDAVVICSPTNMHAQMMEEAAAAKKHIFCEKPIDLQLERVDKALNAVAKAGVKLQMGFNRRFDANFARVREAIVKGEIGALNMLHIISRDPGPPPIEYVRVSGGIFMDMTIHDFDMARFLAGDEVDEIYAAAGVMIDPEIGKAGDLDTALLTLRFKNGVIGTIDNSRKAVYGYDQRVEAFGSAGAVRTENNYPNSALVLNGQRVARDLPLNFFMERYTESFLTEMRQFVDCVLNDKPTPVTGTDARAALLMAIAARRSHDEKRPVKIAEICSQ